VYVLSKHVGEGMYKTRAVNNKEWHWFWTATLTVHDRTNNLYCPKSVPIRQCLHFVLTLPTIKAADLQMLKKISGEIFITDPLIQVRKLTKSLVKHRFSLQNLLRYTYAVAIMYSRNILMAEKRIVCIQSRNVKISRF